MSNNARYHLDPGPEDASAGGTPRVSLNQKTVFARCLYNMALQRGWNQADLARESGLGRDVISTYFRGRSLPGPKNLNKLADALECEPQELLPWSSENAMRGDSHSLELFEAVGHPGEVWLRLNRRITLMQATTILAVLEESDYADELAEEAYRRIVHQSDDNRKK